MITIASFLGVIAGLIVRFTFYSKLFGGRRQRDQNTAAVFMAVMAVSALVYAVSFLLIRALSCYRELAAAMLTGKPSVLASALTKVSGDIARIPTQDLRTALGPLFGRVGGVLIAFLLPFIDLGIEQTPCSTLLHPAGRMPCPATAPPASSSTPPSPRASTNQAPAHRPGLAGRAHSRRHHTVPPRHHPARTRRTS